jgi:VanZ family protein
VSIKKQFFLRSDKSNFNPFLKEKKNIWDYFLLAFLFCCHLLFSCYLTDERFPCAKM